MYRITYLRTFGNNNDHDFGILKGEWKQSLDAYEALKAYVSQEVNELKSRPGVNELTDIAEDMSVEDGMFIAEVEFKQNYETVFKTEYKIVYTK